MATKKKTKTEIKDDVSIMEMVKNNKPPKLTIVAPPQYEIDWDKIAANVAAAANMPADAPKPAASKKKKVESTKAKKETAKPKKAKK